ncbi:MAG: UDP-3-O-(3-hydroxymyristoyl)glucosamine N-acyltransferase [Ignavibacteria bacterium]|nr:UDP-3-O-(3-hydroxymyristoyl)glucosamine N-acyltransferase [Ignavibacteria bacterium]
MQNQAQHLRIDKIALLTGAKIYGDPSVEIDHLAKIEEAGPGALTFLYLASYEKYFEITKATAIFVKNGFKRTRDDIIYLEVHDPNKAFLTVLISHFSPEFNLVGQAKSAYVHPSALVDVNTALGENVYIGAGCRIEKNTKIYPNTVIMDNVTIGEHCLIYPNVTVRENCIIHNNVILHSGCVIGSDGFGYVPGPEKRYIKIPQIGNVILEDNVEIGANTTIDRAALGSTVIKAGTKLDNLVQVAHNVVIGENTVLSAQAGISGSTKIGNHCIIAGQVGVVGHIEIADNVVIGAQSGISKAITKSGMYFGSPAKEHKTALKNEAHIRNLENYVERIKKLEARLTALESITKNEHEQQGQ